jgi:hypothetical protein
MDSSVLERKETHAKETLWECKRVEGEELEDQPGKSSCGQDVDMFR